MTETPAVDPAETIAQGVVQFENLVTERTESLRQAAHARDELDRAYELLQGDLDTTLADFAAYRAKWPATQPRRFDLGMAYKSNTDPAPVEKRLGYPVHARRTYYGGSTAELAKAKAHVLANIAAGRRTSSLSFKLPVSWPQAAAGAADVWAALVALELAKAIEGTTHRIRIAMHHEPEDEKPLTAAHRDEWKAMQVRLAPIFDVPGFEFIVILMGYHSLTASSSIYPLWKLDQAIPDHPAIKGVGYDLYETKGVVRASDGKVGGWRDFDLYLSRVKAFHDTRPGLVWGLSEYSATAAAESERPGVVSRMVAQVESYGGCWLEWFSSNLNSVAGWEMESGGLREASFAAALAGLETR